ncbi:hypothetical protein SAMN06265379_10353 [Saccharicrinis carchari]|uniref:Uncharacterized protein n=1 Tax=Saccharicrinis carchari TaxID=1168039 RepID=A0A521CEJ9_SACCC|nr:glycosyltransferase family 4 protein [Saccharicrinis carchari]SMO57854.1 hypothetical protein SAMN06265379_10353 [Saccharicrinis carchari]
MMKVLLLGEFSGMHQNLARGLREHGVDVTVASDGDLWKNYPRDIDLSRNTDKHRNYFLAKVLKALPKLSGYDVVQLNCPKFLCATPNFNSTIFSYLKRVNSNIFLGAHGMDANYINYDLSGKLKYSVFHTPAMQDDPNIRTLKNIVNDNSEIALNKRVATHAKGIIASGVGYYLSYKDKYPNKITFIPLAIDTEQHPYVSTLQKDTKKIKFFLGMMKGRVVQKGTDVIYRVLKDLQQKYPNDVELTVVESVPFSEYQKLLNSSHVLCDQLYSYEPGLNGLIAQSKGLIVASGVDEEIYRLIGETENKPIIDLNVDERFMMEVFERLLDNKAKLKELSLKNRAYVVKHHDSRVVAKRYLDFWAQQI